MWRIKSKSGFSTYNLAWELHDLLDIPRSVFYSKSGKRYEQPVMGHKIVKAVIRTLVEALQRHERVYIRDFGEFKVVPRAYKQTGPRPIVYSEGPGKIERSPIPLPSRRKYRIKFTPSLALRTIAKMDQPETLNVDERKAVRRWNGTE